jgi:hypothetical protein
MLLTAQQYNNQQQQQQQQASAQQHRPLPPHTSAAYLGPSDPPPVLLAAAAAPLHYNHQGPTVTHTPGGHMLISRHASIGGSTSSTISTHGAVYHLQPAGYSQAGRQQYTAPAQYTGSQAAGGSHGASGHQAHQNTGWQLHAQQPQAQADNNQQHQQHPQHHYSSHQSDPRHMLPLSTSGMTSSMITTTHHHHHKHHASHINSHHEGYGQDRHRHIWITTEVAGTHQAGANGQGSGGGGSSSAGHQVHTTRHGELAGGHNPHSSGMRGGNPSPAAVMGRPTVTSPHIPLPPLQRHTSPPPHERAGTQQNTIERVPSMITLAGPSLGGSGSHTLLPPTPTFRRPPSTGLLSMSVPPPQLPPTSPRAAAGRGGGGEMRRTPSGSQLRGLAGSGSITITNQSESLEPQDGRRRSSRWVQ